MAYSWWRKVVTGRQVRERRTSLRAEQLETRDTPAGIYASAVGPGNAPVVTAYDATTHQQKFVITAYDSSFTGGVNVAVGDVDGDGTADIITGPGAGGGPVINVFSGVDGHKIGSFSIGDVGSRAGVSVATADFDNDGKAEIVVGTIGNGQPLVEVLHFGDGSVVRSFTPFAGAGAVSVATGDVNGDGTPDVIAGAGSGGGPQVTAFDGKTGAQLLNSFAFETSFVGGVGVSAGDLNGDGKADVIVSAGFTGGPRVLVFNGATGTVLQNFFAYDSAQRNGVQAAAFDTGTGTVALVTVDGQGQSPNMKAFDAQTLTPVTVPTLTGLPAAPTVVPPAPPVSPPPPASPPPPVSPPAVTDDSGMVNSLPPLDSTSWQTKSDGLKTWDVQVGSGTAVTSGSTIQVYYTGWLTNGTKFDSARSPASPATFQLSKLIPGWQEGLIGMQPGGIRRLYVPYALGYGVSGSGTTIPPYSDLVFELKLVSTT
jgi:hypothetical protein